MADEPRQVGSFEVLDVLGRGGMAMVYLARQPSMGRTVALKELFFGAHGNGDFAARFIHEAQIAGSLGQHPSVVVVYDYFEADGGAYIAMEHLRRGSLCPYMREMTLPRALGVLEGVLSGLQHAGERGIVHRDLKPANVLVTDDGRVKVADFGIAKAYDATTHLTVSGQALGTPAYMAPEQIRGEAVSPRTDLYAVGVLAFELFTGELPFDRRLPPMSMLYQHLNEPPPDPGALNPALPPEIRRWTARMLSKDADNRPETAAEAWTALEEAAVDHLGWRWRREARLAEPGVTAPGRPLTPAPFDGADDTPAGGQDDSARRPGYVTYVEPPAPRPPVEDEQPEVEAFRPQPEPVEPTRPPSAPVVPPAPAERRSRRRPAVVGVLAGALAVGGVVVALGLGGGGAGAPDVASSTPTPSPVSSPSPTATPSKPPSSKADARARLSAFIPSSVRGDCEYEDDPEPGLAKMACFHADNYFVFTLYASEGAARADFRSWVDFVDDDHSRRSSCDAATEGHYHRSQWSSAGGGGDLMCYADTGGGPAWVHWTRHGLPLQASVQADTIDEAAAAFRAIT